VSLIRVGYDRSRRAAEKIGMSLAEEIERNSAGYWLYRIER
jgi:hypothetical protein